MRYLLHESQLNELAARQAYLYDIFRMYFLPGKPEGRYIPLIPMGNSGPDILFITGHTNYVWDYLDASINKIPERNIVITSCMGSSFEYFATKKIMYVPSIDESVCVLRDGKPYGFDFRISDAELNLYNATGEIVERIQKAYIQLPHKERK